MNQGSWEKWLTQRLGRESTRKAWFIFLSQKVIKFSRNDGCISKGLKDQLKGVCAGQI